METPPSCKMIPGLKAVVSELGGNAPVHLAIGIFDGVHRGHQRVVNAAIETARKDGGLALVLTFDPHPSRIFRPETPALLIMPIKERVRRLCELGVNAVVVHPFDKSFAALHAEEFIPMLKQYIPSLAAIYVGENWQFGKGRKGNIAFLSEESRKQGLRLQSVSACEEGGSLVSSTRIRACLKKGDVEEANKLLGYKYFSDGIVQQGKQLGRTIGFPTLNLDWEPEKKPLFGVYAVRVREKSGSFIKAVANYGLRPTVESSGKPLLEVHTLEASPLNYGDEIYVEWEHFIRPEKRFDGIESLKKQLQEDVELAKMWFARPSMVEK